LRSDVRLRLLRLAPAGTIQRDQRAGQQNSDRLRGEHDTNGTEALGHRPLAAQPPQWQREPPLCCNSTSQPARRTHRSWSARGCRSPPTAWQPSEPDRGQRGFSSAIQSAAAAGEGQAHSSPASIPMRPPSRLSHLGLHGLLGQLVQVRIPRIGELSHGWGRKGGKEGEGSAARWSRGDDRAAAAHISVTTNCASVTPSERCGPCAIQCTRVRLPMTSGQPQRAATRSMGGGSIGDVQSCDSCPLLQPLPPSPSSPRLLVPALIARPTACCVSRRSMVSDGDRIGGGESPSRVAAGCGVHDPLADRSRHSPYHPRASGSATRTAGEAEERDS